jgi:hypothetical protein
MPFLKETMCDKPLDGIESYDDQNERFILSKNEIIPTAMGNHSNKIQNNPMLRIVVFFINFHKKSN